MKSDTPLDYAVFQLSPKRSRCELFVSGEGKTEKLASGLLKPFVTHLKVAEEQVAQAFQSIKLEVEIRKNGGTWFTKGTLERFVRFVSTPEVLELVNTFDAEMSQLEGARRIYLQGAGNQVSSILGETETATTTAADITKKELLRAIDVRLAAVKQDLTTACARASAAGFTLDNVSELLLFADHFGAHRLNEACGKFISLCQRRPELINPWKGIDDRNVRSSSGSDMSIDDTIEEDVPVKPNGPHAQTQHQVTTHSLDPSKPATCPPKYSLNFPLQHYSREPSCEREEARENDVEKEIGTVLEPSPSSQQQPARRLSVQDRINLFENKQKEQSGGSSGGKVGVGKAPELRRLSSDVVEKNSVPEKAVLRRWSGASDMSIELNNEKKENELVLTPTSSLNSQTQSTNGQNRVEDKDSATSKLESTLRGDSDTNQNTQLRDQAATHNNFRVFQSRAEHVGPKDQVPSQAQFKGFPDGAEAVGLKDSFASQAQVRPFLSRADDIGSEGGETSEAFPRAYTSRSEDVALKEQSVDQPQSGTDPGKKQDVGLSLKDRSGSLGLLETLSNKGKDKELAVSHGSCRGGVGKVEEAEKSDLLAPPQSQWKNFLGNAEEVGKSDCLIPESRWSSFPGKAGHVGKEELVASQSLLGQSSPTMVEELGTKDSGSRGMKFHKQSSAPQQVRKMQGRKNDKSSTKGNVELGFRGRTVVESQEMFALASSLPVEPVQKVRPSRGNQELNDELQMKADELEKLFAAHKLRVPGDQTASSRRSQLADVHGGQATGNVEKRPEEVFPTQLLEKDQVGEPSTSLNNRVEFDVNSLMKMVDNQRYGNSLKYKVADSGSLEDFRGKFYEQYMQKREAKLKEESGSKRAQKEAKMKAMLDSLECSAAEMKASFGGSADRQDSTLQARRRAEKLRSFNVRTAMRSKDQLPSESFESDGEDDLPEFPERTQYVQERSLNEPLFGDGSSRSTQPKKLLPNRSLSSSTPRTSAASAPRSSAKATNSGSGRRRIQSENPVAQSVPNFSDLRKENTKPSTVTSKTAARLQSRNYSRSKSTNEDITLVKEEKPQRSQSLRKSSVGVSEPKELSPLNSEGVVLTPLRFSKEHSDQSLYNKIPKNGETRPFLRKGNGIGPGTGASLAKLKASMSSENLKDSEESEELVDQTEELVDQAEELVDEAEDPTDLVKEEEEFERVSDEPPLKSRDFPTESDNEKPRLSQESEKYGDRGSENGEVLRSLSQVDDDSAAALGAVSSKFNTSAGTVQESPGESPASWNSRMQQSFSYMHEAWDVDASVDSPIGSPASWNSHALTQMMEVDVARMRRKWGSAQKPILVANASHQSRKDVTKGFKRLLKFGRKSRGSESLITDWVSATTSEGDDESEDIRDPANRSSEDLRKSRMGFSQGHSSYDGFTEGEIFPDQVQTLRSSIPAPPANFKLREDHLSGSSLKAPRSFFSLSSFRSKGSESKPR